MSLSSPSAQATQTAQPSSIAQAATTARCAVRVRFLAALVGIAVAASITSFYVEFGLLSKNSFATSATFSDKSIQDRAADTHLHASADENIRIIAMCGGTHLFDDAFRKISEWLPIWYAGMYQRPEDVTIPQQSWCENKIEQWVVSELQRRKMTDISKVTSSIEVIYGGDELFRQKSPLNTTFVGQSNEPPKWEGGMHTPSRPFHIQRHFNYWGEVAWSKGILCSQDDSKIHVYRSRQLWSVAQEENCAVVHLPAILNYVQGFLHHRIQTGLSPANETVLSLLSRRLTRNQARQSLSSKSNFCILITMTTFQPKYSTDALVRHALCRLLTKQYKPCVAIASWKGQKTHNITIAEGLENTSGAMKDFKFAITMPDHFQDGYIAEKTLTPYLASSVAITAIPKIGQYVNAEGMISCHLPEEELRKVQMYYKGDFKWMPFNTTPDMWKSEDKITPIKYDPYANNKKGDEPVLEFATSQWEEALQPCIEEIIRVDQDDSVYMEKLMQPYLLNEGKKSMFDETYLAMSMLRWFLWANSPLVRGLEDRIKSLDGMMEQTPDWGEPPVKTFEDGVDYYFKTKNEVGVSRPVVRQNIVQQNTVQQGFSIHPPILYGHVHMAKTGGTSLNGKMANMFERVCGHKGYSYDAFQENERLTRKEMEGQVIHPQGRSRVFFPTMKEIGFEDCDYISVERDWQFWKEYFGNGTFHGLRMELHVPCRNRIDHLMSMCNHKREKITCDAKTEEELIESVRKCVLGLGRYNHDMLKHFDVKCFDFKKQFTEYTKYMSGILQKRRFQSTHVVKKETNLPRSKTDECIWENVTVLEKVEKYLLETFPYYQFCNICMGSKNEITAANGSRLGEEKKQSSNK